jgi:hypothetical protein
MRREYPRSSMSQSLSVSNDFVRWREPDIEEDGPSCRGNGIGRGYIAWLQYRDDSSSDSLLVTTDIRQK